MACGDLLYVRLRVYGKMIVWYTCGCGVGWVTLRVCWMILLYVGQFDEGDDDFLLCWQCD